MFVNSKDLNDNLSFVPTEDSKNIENDKIQDLFETHLPDMSNPPLSNETLQNVVVTQETSAKTKKKRKKKKNTHNLTYEQKVGRFINQMQEIFQTMKTQSVEKEIQMPTFNAWIKKHLEEEYFCTNTFSLLDMLKYNLLKKINKLKNDPLIKDNKQNLENLIDFETTLLLLDGLYEAPRDFDEEKIISNHRLDLCESFTFLDQESQHNFYLFSYLIFMITQNENCDPIFDNLATIKVKELIEHPTLNIKPNISFEKIKIQLLETINYYKNSLKILESFNSSLLKRKIEIKYDLNIVTKEDEIIEKDEQFSTTYLIYKLNKHLDVLYDKISQRFITIDDYYNQLSSLIIIFDTAIEISFLMKTFYEHQDSFIPFFIENKILTEYSKIASKNISFSQVDLFFDLSLCIKEIENNFITPYIYGFNLLLKDNITDNHKILKFFNINLGLYTNIRENLTEMFRGDAEIENFNKKINTLEKIIQKYSNAEQVNALTLWNKFLISSDILTFAISLEKAVKECILTKIKINMNSLKHEKNPEKIEIIKNDLNKYSQQYEDCFLAMNLINEIFNLYKKDNKIDTQPKEKNKPKKQPIKQKKLTETNEPSLSEKSLEKPNDDLIDTSIKKESVKDKVTKNIPKIAPSKNTVKNTSKNIPIREEKKEEPSLFDSFNEFFDDMGWNAHLKRRELLRLLKDCGWSIDSSEGKGSHTKVQGPNGTVTVVPKRDVIPVGTLNSLKNSVIEDKLKTESSPSPKNQPKKTQTKKKRRK